MSDIFPNPNTISYLKGWADGYKNGVEENPYNGETQSEDNIQYKWGYQAGVANFCRENHLEDYQD